MKQLTFDHHDELVPGVWQSYFRPASPLSYVAGQYAELRLPHAQADPRGNGRTFTLASVPGEDLVSFIYWANEPTSLYKHNLLSLRPGDEAQLGDVMGDLVLPKLPNVPLVFVAGGIGMASFTAILKLLQQRSEQRTIHLFYSLRNKYDDAFKQQVDTFPFASKQRFVRPNYLSATEIAKVADENSLIYLSGSENFVTGIRDQLVASGFNHSQIIFDYYDGYADL